MPGPGRLVAICALLTTSALAFADSTPAPIAPAVEIAPEQLIRELGSPVYSDRDRATKALWKMGERARAALTGAAHSGDPEEERYLNAAQLQQPQARAHSDRGEEGHHQDVAQHQIRLDVHHPIAQAEYGEREYQAADYRSGDVQPVEHGHAVLEPNANPET